VSYSKFRWPRFEFTGLQNRLLASLTKSEVDADKPPISAPQVRFLARLLRTTVCARPAATPRILPVKMFPAEQPAEAEALYVLDGVAGPVELVGAAPTVLAIVPSRPERGPTNPSLQPRQVESYIARIERAISRTKWAR
jgi:hypothetical protein